MNGLDDLVQTDDVHLEGHDQTGEEEEEQPVAKFGLCARQCIPGHAAEHDDQKNAHRCDEQRVGKGTGKLHLLPSVDVVLQIEGGWQRQRAGRGFCGRFQCGDDQIINGNKPQEREQNHQHFGNDKAASFKFTRVH